MPPRPRPAREAPETESRAPRIPKGLILWPLALVALILLLNSYGLGTPVDTLSLNDFEKAVASRWIQDPVFLDDAKDRIEGTLRRPELAGEPRRFRVDFPREYLRHEKIDAWTKQGLVVTTKKDSWFRQMLLLNLLPILIFAGLLWFIIVRQIRASGGGGGILSFGKSRARLASKERVQVTFEDVAGIDEAKEEVRELIEFLKNPARFKRIGGRIPRGVILVGPPGTGKTLLAKAIAGEANVPFFSISGSDFVEMFVGVGASRVRDLFKQAKENSPCIVFLDEIDAVGRKRGQAYGGGHEEWAQTLNAILVEMDGFDTDQGIIVIAASNRPDVLDPALLRPGRFDRQIVLDLPDVKGREEILRLHARKVRLGKDADLAALARGTPTYSGADLEAIINEAAIRAALAGKDAVEMTDLWEARDKHRWGRQKTSRVMEEEDKRITAFHEGGHALAAKLLPDVEPLLKVTIIPRGMALGATMQLPEKDKYHMQRKAILGTIKVLYAGRVAEELFCNDISTGAHDDLRRATILAEKMVCEWGMSDRIGPMIVGREGEVPPIFGEWNLVKSQSEQTSDLVDAEIKRILTECYEGTRALMQGRRADLERIAEALLKYEVLDGAEIDLLLAGQPLTREPKAPAAPPPGAPAKPASGEGRAPGAAAAPSTA